MTIEEKWELHDDEYLEFDKVENKRSKRPDLHAFMLLDELFPGESDIVAASEHDQIWLDIDGDQLEGLSDEHIIELRRCGVMLHGEFEGLSMFV